MSAFTFVLFFALSLVSSTGLFSQTEVPEERKSFLTFSGIISKAKTYNGLLIYDNPLNQHWTAGTGLWYQHSRPEGMPAINSFLILSRLYYNFNTKPVWKRVHFYSGLEINFPLNFQVINIGILTGSRIKITSKLHGLIEIPYYLNEDGGVFFRAGFSLKFN